MNTSDLFKLSITYEIVTSNCLDSKLLDLAGMGPLIWSRLPTLNFKNDNQTLRMIETLNSFKRNIRKVNLSTLVNIIDVFRLFNKFCK